MARPPLVDQDGQGDLPAKGRFWIDPAAMWVPSEMREKYDDLPAPPMPVFRSPTEATARYSSFRRFTVTIEDVTATLPSETPEAPPEP